MSYSEQGNDVVLRMSREDYGLLSNSVGLAIAWAIYREPICELWNRLNSGNPNYTPYQVENERKQS